MLALGVLLLLGLGLKHHRFTPLAVKAVVAARVEGQLAPFQMNDAVHCLVEQVAVVRNQKHLVRIARHVGFQPQRTFQIEVVGRFVQQQEVRLGEKNRCERNAHAPAPGEGRARTLLGFRVETQTGKDGTCTSFRRMAADVCQPGMDLGNALRVGRGLCLREQAAALRVGSQDDLKKTLLRSRCLLRDLTDAGSLGYLNGTTFRTQVTGDDLEQGRLAGAIAPNKSGLGPCGQGDAGLIDEKASADAVGEVGYLQHGADLWLRLGRHARAPAPRVEKIPLWYGLRCRFQPVQGHALSCLRDCPGKGQHSSKEARSTG